MTAGFSVPAIHLETSENIRNTVRRLADADHEIAVHGHRRTSYVETSYETADEELTRMIDLFESEIDGRPTGFHAPDMRCSRETGQAAADHGIERIVGTNSADADPSLPPLNLEFPCDLQLFERGQSPTAVVGRVEKQAEDGSLLLCLPNIHAVHDATREFTDWLTDVSLAAPNAVVEGDGGRPGLLLGWVPPFGVG